MGPVDWSEDIFKEVRAESEEGQSGIVVAYVDH